MVSVDSVRIQVNPHFTFESSRRIRLFFRSPDHLIYTPHNASSDVLCLQCENFALPFTKAEYFDTITMVHLVDSMVFYCNDYGSKLRTEQIMPKLQQKTQWQRCAYLDTEVVRTHLLTRMFLVACYTWNTVFESNNTIISFGWKEELHM